MLSMPGSGQLAASFSRISVIVQKSGLSLHVEEGRAGVGLGVRDWRLRRRWWVEGVGAGPGEESGGWEAEACGQRRGGLGRPLVLHRRRGRAGRGRGSVVPAHGQVHKGEHVELRHDGEAQEHAV